MPTVLPSSAAAVGTSAPPRVSVSPNSATKGDCEAIARAPRRRLRLLLLLRGGEGRHGRRRAAAADIKPVRPASPRAPPSLKGTNRRRGLAAYGSHPHALFPSTHAHASTHLKGREALAAALRHMRDRARLHTAACRRVAASTACLGMAQP
jgi:hypothetical protein